ncbi:MAG: GyrI-like domain-containing protein [Bacteroidetes bacterium]|nr:GyrI-like domain-containing protein [Bacteroidota bacterium]
MAAPSFQLLTSPQRWIAGIPANFENVMQADTRHWQQFMPRLRGIKNRLGGHLVSASVYQPSENGLFNPFAPVQKWAGVEVETGEALPEGMHTLLIPAGEYAVFRYQGLPSGASSFFKAVFSESLPQAGLLIDSRPHFELLPPGYSATDPNAEEEVWVPVMRM